MAEVREVENHDTPSYSEAIANLWGKINVKHTELEIMYESRSLKIEQGVCAKDIEKEINGAVDLSLAYEDAIYDLQMLEKLFLEKEKKLNDDSAFRREKMREIHRSVEIELKVRRYIIRNNECTKSSERKLMELYLELSRHNHELNSLSIKISELKKEKMNDLKKVLERDYSEGIFVPPRLLSTFQF